MKNLSFIQKNIFDSFLFAQEVAKKLNSRIATFHDLINLRIKQDYDNSFIWNRWFTPFASLYLGKHNNKRLIVVAQHLGPLNTRERFLQWADSGINDEGSTRKKNGAAGLPKISQQEFADLIEGKFGEVDVLDFEDYCIMHGHNLHGSFILHANASDDPLLMSLFGPGFNDFLAKHLQISSDNAKKKNKKEGAGYKILELGIRDCYGWWLFGEKIFDFPDDQPLALFLTLGRISSYGNNDLAMATEIRTHEDTGHGNFVVLNDENEDVVSVNYNKENYMKHLVPNQEKIPKFFTLMDMNGAMFVQYPKKGARMDTDEPMFEVLEYEKIGDRTAFKTRIYGSPFLKYDIQEVISLAPYGANAYIIDREISGHEIATVPVQFFKVKIKEDQRILSSQEVASNLDLLLKINGINLV